MGEAGEAKAQSWLIGTGQALPAPVRLALLRSLYGTLPIYFGGVVSTFSVALILALRIGTPAFYLWVAFEAVLAAVRLRAIVACRRALAKGQAGPVRDYAILSLMWAGSVGFGAFIAIGSGDWVAALAACVSSAAMLGGICFRYFAAPRLAAAMLCAMGLPGAAACLLSGEPVLLIAAAQIPLYILTMASAARQMNRTLVKALCAERDQAERARTDPLTGLSNRDGLASAIERRPAGEQLGCFFIDLDGFKGVNDRLGHRAGDRLLVMVGERLRKAMNENAILARVGGDEFVVVAPCADENAAQTFGERIASAVAGQPYIVEDQGVFIGASVGAALRSELGLDDLMSAADEALYRAKASGQSACVVAGAARPAGNDRRADPRPPLRLVRA